MPCLPSRFAAVIQAFAPLFFQRSWQQAEVLLTGAVLAPGKRTVTSLLRIMGLAHEQRFVNYHRVFDRAEWSARAASHVPLKLLLDVFVPTGLVVSASTTRSSADGASASRPKAFISTRYAPAMGTASRRVAYAGSASCFWH